MTKTRRTGKRRKKKRDPTSVLINEMAAKQAESRDGKTGEECNFTEHGETATLETKSTLIKTPEQALKKANIDTSLWEIERQTVNSWEVAAFDRNAQTWRVQPLWQVKLHLRRKIAKKYQEAFDWLFEHFKRHRYKPTKTVKRVGSCMLEPSLCDAHFGRYSWSGDCGDDWDTEKAATVYENAVNDIIGRVKGWPISKIVLPLGNDFYHVNNWLGTTANDTAQDVDTRVSRVFRIGFLAVHRAIMRLRQISPVEVLYVPGNHDRETSHYLCFGLEQRFYNDPDVTVDMSPKSRKYTQWGCNLLGFTHGDEEKHRDLPTIMAAEQPLAWAETTHREIHLGHFHRARQTVHQTTDEFGGVRVRVLPSLGGTDSWHYRKGYVGNVRAAEAYLWDKQEGYVGHFSVNARET